MKKFICALFTVIFLISTIAIAETDYASLSDTELMSEINKARNELAKRAFAVENKTVLFDQDGVSMYLTGEQEVSKSWNDDIYLVLNVVVVNSSSHDIDMLSKQSSVNGWDISLSTPSSIAAGKKKKGELKFNITDTDATTLEELEDAEMKLLIYDHNSWADLFETGIITISFNQ